MISERIIDFLKENDIIFLSSEGGADMRKYKAPKLVATNKKKNSKNVFAMRM